MNQRIAFFDFDGTITTRDTLLEFIKFSKGSFRFYLGFLLSGPWLVAYKLKVISNQRAKERVLHFFFKGDSRQAFQEECEQFSREILPRLIRPRALAEISRLQEAGFSVVIVSASPENWIQSWASRLNVQLIASRLKIRNDCLTGTIDGINCHGQEKVRRIQEAYSLNGYRDIYAYGDTSGDKPMLGLANISFFKPFR